MRPDRIIVGEVRGEEALDMLQAMNTGHDGSLTTIHANSPRDALYRLDTMVAMANLNIPERAVRQQIASADQPHRPGDAAVGRHAQGDGDLRDHRHGAGRHHDAGHLRVRADRRSTSDGKVTRPVPRHRHPSEVQPTHLAAVRHARCRWRCSSTCRRSPERTESRCMLSAVAYVRRRSGHRPRRVLAVRRAARGAASRRRCSGGFARRCADAAKARVAIC